MRRLSLAPLILVGAVLTGVPVSAVTVDQIVALSKAGVSEAVILAVIDRDRTIMTIEAAQIVALKHEGVSDAVVMAMLKSGRDEAEAAVQAQAEWNAASIVAGLSTTPDLVIIGHGPDRPNVLRNFIDPESAFAAPSLAYAPYLPYVVAGVRRDGRHRRSVRVPETRFEPGPDPRVPTSFMAAPPDISPRGMFFNDGGGPARGIFFSKQ